MPLDLHPSPCRLLLPLQPTSGSNSHSGTSLAVHSGTWHSMSLPRYLVSIDVFKATAMVIVLALHTFVLSGLTTERNGALLGFEMMSGLFYELAGLGTARSVCRALSDGQLKRGVLGRLLRRGLMLVGASILLRGLTIIAVQYGLEPLLEEGYERAARWARWHVGELLQRTVFDLRALTFHGACQLLAAPLLLSVLHSGDGGEAGKGRQRVASGRSAMALLGAGLLVLAITPWLRSRADAATCCVPDHATLGYAGKCSSALDRYARGWTNTRRYSAPLPGTAAECGRIECKRRRLCERTLHSGVRSNQTGRVGEPDPLDQGD